MKNSILLGLLAFGSALFAQDAAPGWTYDPTGLEDRRSLRRSAVAGLESNADMERCAEAIGQYLAPGLEIELREMNSRNSPFAEHALFERIWNGIAVYRGEVKINRSNSGKLLSWYALEMEHQEVDFALLPSSAPSVEPEPADLTPYLEQEVWFPVREGLIRAELKRYRNFSNLHIETVRGQNGVLLFARDLTAYHSALPNDTTLQLKVFNPDPLTTAGYTYGGDPNGLLIDNNDQDIGALNNQRQSVTVKGEYRNNSFQLRNSRIVLKDFDDPVQAIAVRSSPIFDFTRAQSGFEDCNSYYHLSTYQEHMQSLGFNLCEDTVFVDPHGWSGMDQSSFNYDPSGGGNLTLGEGGVDDAEDADVIVHEYGHAISYSAAPNTNNGTERRCLDEALGDYLAASYSHSINPFGWERVFSWDGHNIFWAGRMASSTKFYPNLNFGGNIYIHAELWAAAIMDIYFALGRSVADATLLQSLYAYSSNIGFPEAALEYLAADSLRTGGANALAMYTAFNNRGILNIPNFSTDESGARAAGISVYGSTSFAQGESLVVHSETALGEWRLSDLLGRVHRSGFSGQYTLELSSETLTAGVYILSLHTQYGLASFRLVKH